MSLQHLADSNKRLEQYRNSKLKFSQRLADAVAKWTGSWSFLLIHLLGFVLWLAFGFNFNFLTLIVSFEAILLMNILLMSQNLQAQKDELRDEADYQADLQSAQAVEELKQSIKELQKKLKS